MIRCPKCKSYAVENSNVTVTNIPPQQIYKCKDCGHGFYVPLGEPKIEKDITSYAKSTFLKTVIETGEIPNSISYHGKSYFFSKAEKDKYFYTNKSLTVYLNIDKDLLLEADKIHEEILELFDRLEERNV